MYATPRTDFFSQPADSSKLYAMYPLCHRFKDVWPRSCTLLLSPQNEPIRSVKTFDGVCSPSPAPLPL